MSPQDLGGHSFIVKIWIEETASEAGRATWRGRISHVGSPDYRYLQELDEVADFIAPYLAGLGIRLSTYWRVRRWLRSRRLLGRRLR
jgi:hypothetical protein